MVQPPLKHVVQQTNQGQALGNLTVPLAIGVLNPDPYTNVTNIKATNIIKKLTLMLDFGISNGEFNANSLIVLNMYLGFNINGAQPMPLASAVGQSHISNQVFWQEQVMLYSGVTGVTNNQSNTKIIRVEIPIPPSWSKLGDGDQLEFHISAVGAAGQTYDFVLTAIYKEVYP